MTRGFPGGPVVKTLPSSAGITGSILGPRAHFPRNWNVKQKQDCNKFNKDFKNGPHQKKQKELFLIDKWLEFELSVHRNSVALDVEKRLNLTSNEGKCKIQTRSGLSLRCTRSDNSIVMTIWGNRTDTLGRVTQYPDTSKMYEPYDSVNPRVCPRKPPTCVRQGR